MLLSAAPLPGVSVGAALQQLMRCAASEASESPGTRLRSGFARLGAQRSHGAVIRPHCWNFRDQCTRSKQLLWVPSCEAEIWPRPKSTPAAMNGRVGLIQHTWHRSAELCWRKGAPLLQSRGRQAAGLAQAGGQAGLTKDGTSSGGSSGRGDLSPWIRSEPCSTHHSRCEQTQAVAARSCGAAWTGSALKHLTMSCSSRGRDMGLGHIWHARFGTGRLVWRSNTLTGDVFTHSNCRMVAANTNMRSERG